MKFPSAVGAEGGARPGRVGPSLQPVPLVPLGKSCRAGLILLTYFFFLPVEVARRRWENEEVKSCPRSAAPSRSHNTTRSQTISLPLRKELEFLSGEAAAAELRSRCLL